MFTSTPSVIRMNDTKAADFDPSTFEDHYETALIELLKKKQAGFQRPRARKACAAHVINLRDALRASIAADTKKPKAASKRARDRRKTFATCLWGTPSALLRWPSTGPPIRGSDL
jgi:non-homologous end joining protein Ku